MRNLFQSASKFWNWFLFGSCNVAIVPGLRIAMAVLLTINTLVWWQDAEMWFTDAGVLSSTTAQYLNNHRHWSLLWWLPATAQTVQVCLAIMLLQSVLLLLGIWSRVQMGCLFIWLVSFQHRNPLICDGEDTLFRLFSFTMIFLPLDSGWSLSRVLLRNKALPELVDSSQAWALRLMQFQMIVIYASATWNKCLGKTWQDGTAMYFVSHMNDHFGRLSGIVPYYDQLWFVQLQTWGALAVEGLLPLTLWLPKVRWIAIVVGIAFHLCIELTMNLFLFEWLMIVGLLSFVPAGRLTRY